MAKENAGVSIEHEAINIVDEYAKGYLPGNRSMAIEIIARERAKIR